MTIENGCHMLLITASEWHLIENNNEHIISER